MNMKKIEDYSFHDGRILAISISHDCAEILFEKWDNAHIKLLFGDYFRIRDYHSVGQDISVLLVNTSKEMLDEVINCNLNDGGSTEETLGLTSYSFTNSCDDMVIFEIIARNVKIIEL